MTVHPVHPTSSSEIAPRMSVFLACSSANRALTTVLCTFCRQLSHIEARTRGNRDPTSATPGGTLSKKTQGLAPESVFTREFTLPNNYTSQLLDDVVDMIVGMLTMIIVRNSEVV